MDKCSPLVAIRYNCFSVEHVRGLSKRQIIGYLVEVPMSFLLPHSDGREQESFSCYLHTHVSQVPMAWDNQIGRASCRERV